MPEDTANPLDPGHAIPYGERIASEKAAARARSAAEQADEAAVSNLLDLVRQVALTDSGLREVRELLQRHEEDEGFAAETRRQEAQARWRLPFWILVSLTMVASGVTFAPDTAALILKNVAALLPSWVQEGWRLRVAVVLIEMFVTGLLLALKPLIDLLGAWRARHAAMSAAAHRAAQARWRCSLAGTVGYLGCVMSMMAITESADKARQAEVEQKRQRAEENQAALKMFMQKMDSVNAGPATGVPYGRPQKPDVAVVPAGTNWTWIGENFPKLGLMLILLLAHTALLFMPTTPFGRLPLARQTPEKLIARERALQEKFDDQVAESAKLFGDLDSRAPQLMDRVRAGLGIRALQWIAVHMGATDQPAPPTAGAAGAPAPDPASEPPKPDGATPPEDPLDGHV